MNSKCHSVHPVTPWTTPLILSQGAPPGKSDDGRRVGDGTVHCVGGWLDRHNITRIFLALHNLVLCLYFPMQVRVGFGRACFRLCAEPRHKWLGSVFVLVVHTLLLCIYCAT